MWGKIAWQCAKVKDGVEDEVVKGGSEAFCWFSFGK